MAVVYGDFNCPYSYLASQRADLLSRAGALVVDWRAVEHDRGLSVTGSRTDSDRAARDRELAEVASLAVPGEHVPATPPAVVSNTEAAVAAYAEAVSDDIGGELRRRLFRAVWVDGRNLSSADEVRRLITAVMWPQEDITRDGQPLTTAGWCRIRRWRQDWLALPSQVIPVVIGPDHVVRSGAGTLRYLAGLCAAAHGEPQLPAQAGTTGDHHQFPGTALAREYTV